MALIAGVGNVNAAERSAKSISRPATKTTISRPAAKTTISRPATKTTISRTATTQNKATTARATATPRNATSARGASTPPRRTTARATIDLYTKPTETFGTGYNTCRDAYFTCMDQFCGTLDDKYRRCICSSKIYEVQNRERALGNASNQLQDFRDLQLTVVDKSSNEVNAMINGTAGEKQQNFMKDTSNAASELSGISAILSKTKKQSLSTQGTVDIAGSIDTIWSTTGLMAGVNISNLTGEALYNAVHAQCAQMVADRCPTDAIQTMVTSAYGMYIENDCNLLLGALNGEKQNANTAIRTVGKELQGLRLENYNNHNSSDIHQCIAQVRQDITADTACGPDYIHCLDITGLYLNITTGEPIYSPEFYQLGYQLSLSGDILTNETNRLMVANLSDKRIYAERGLDTCRDISDMVWDEFMRQAITEIYQGQQERIRTVKNECLEVINKCYDEKNQSLKDFSNTDEHLLLGARLELSEQLCQEKLDACSNLYGGGTNGLNELVATMHNITNQKIGQQCVDALTSYAQDLCAAPGNDTLHASPYGCRTYAPGSHQYSTNIMCILQTLTGKIAGNIETSTTDKFGDYTCEIEFKYTSCAKGYYMSYMGKYDPTPQYGNTCKPCPDCYTCDGVDAAPEASDTGDCATQHDLINECGSDQYIGSLYQKLAKYALQVCVRPSESGKNLPASVLQDINKVMDATRIKMATELSKECERLGGFWVSTPTDTTNPTLYKLFYDQTSAHTAWGYCQTPQTTDNNTSTEQNTSKQDTTTEQGTTTEEAPPTEEETPTDA